MSEQDRLRAIRSEVERLAARPAAPAPLPTGLAPLDTMLGGGLPRGALIEVWGPTCGKSTLALHVAAAAQQSGRSAAWIDADRTFDPAWAAGIGVDLDRMPVFRPEAAEEALEIARQLAVSGALDLLVIDSVAALTPRLELDAALGVGMPSLQARVLGSGLRKLAMVAPRTGVTFLFVNQVRTRVGASGHEPLTSAGGPSLKLYAALRIVMTPLSRRLVSFRVLKTRGAGYGARPVELPWTPGRGFAAAP